MDNKELRDMEELIPGNMIDHIHGTDDPVTDNDEIAYMQERICEMIEADYQEDLKLFYPDGDRND